jgi:lipopolysaccharide/colanic/teichoic acid biosynthesis glycosyltransferase
MRFLEDGADWKSSAAAFPYRTASSTTGMTYLRSNDILGDVVLSSIASAEGGAQAWPLQRSRPGDEDRSVAFNFRPPPARPVQLAIKRLLDILGSLLGLIVLAPVMIAIALMIKATSRGPVLFGQERTGHGNGTFRILKYRTMYIDRCDVSGVSQTVENDPRITPIGRILRRTNLDELPQLVNVLIGDMSLVGPRPHVPGMLAAGMPYEELVLGYENRHYMRPGITGLAQVHGLRGPTVDHEPSVLRIARDLEYIRDFSIWLDIKILVRTFVSEARGGSGF